MQLPRAVVGLVATLSIYACVVAPKPGQWSDGAGSGPDGGQALLSPPASYQEFCGQYARAWCPGHLKCCDAPEERHATVAECEQALEQECRLYLSQPAYSSCVRYDKSAAQTYLDKLQAMTPTCTLASLPWYGEIFRGVTPAGGNCSYTLGGYYFSAICCQDGTLCTAESVNGEAVTAQCKAGLKQLGESCIGGQCADGLYCAYGPSTEPTGHCLATKADGASCSWGYECASRRCEGGTCQPLDARSVYCGKAWSCAMTRYYWSSSACNLSFRCDGDEDLELKCTKSGDDAWRCACQRNAVEEKVFNSSGICSLKPNKLLAAVRTGCGWSQLSQ
jgi:hypothetical protein